MIDDVWDSLHLRPFMRGGKQCRRLLTTRQPPIAASAQCVNVDEMGVDEAAALLREDGPGLDPDRINEISKRLGRWPLALGLARAIVERRIMAREKAATMTSDEPAHLNEGVYQAAVEFRQAGSPANRRVIIWLTDNLPNVPYRKEYPAHTEVEAFRALHEEDVVVAPMLLKSRFWAVLGPIVQASEASQKKSFPPGDARKYAELTGGQAVGLRGKRPEERLAQLIDELRARYTIAYRPPDPQPAGTFRKIRVELVPSGTLRSKEWMVLARQGYYRK